jgi:hypothetical protein
MPSVPGWDVVVEITPLEGADAERAERWAAEFTERCLPFVRDGLAGLKWATPDTHCGDFRFGRGFSLDWYALARFLHGLLPAGSLLVQEDLLTHPGDPGVATSLDGDWSMVAVGRHMVGVVRVGADPLSLVPMLRGGTTWQSPATVALAPEVSPENLLAVLTEGDPALVTVGLTSVYDGESVLIGRRR